MHVYLRAILPGGELANVGHYACDVVPRIDENIELWLHQGYTSALDENDYSIPDTVVTFRATSVIYSASNWLATEEWMKPYKEVSNSVTVDVSAWDDKAKRYLKRLAEKARQES